MHLSRPIKKYFLVSLCLIRNYGWKLGRRRITGTFPRNQVVHPGDYGNIPGFLVYVRKTCCIRFTYYYCFSYSLIQWRLPYERKLILRYLLATVS